MFTPNQPKQILSIGNVQDNFVFILKNFQVNDQIKIVEDLPRLKPVRTVTKMSKANNPYSLIHIRIKHNNFEADLEMSEFDFPMFAIAFPKDSANLKGTTMAYDGRRWQYICTDNSPNDTAPASQIQVAPDPNAHMNKMVADMQYISKVGTDVTIKVLTNICDSIQPGKAVEMIQQAKAQGLIYEQNGVYKVA